jgi:N-acetylglutamate synthase-like GNAT family acetyltransferase
VTIGLITRPATTADVPALVALVNSAYRGDSSKAGWTTEADLLGGRRVDVDGLTATIARPGNVILLHEGDHVPVACVHLERTAEDCYLGMLTIRPTLQGAGLGRQMLNTGLRERFT